MVKILPDICVLTIQFLECSECSTVEYGEVFVELEFHFFLPLSRQSCGGDYQHSFDDVPELQFFHYKGCFYGLSKAHLIGKEVSGPELVDNTVQDEYLVRERHYLVACSGHWFLARGGRINGMGEEVQFEL